jgi:hypothetical protein
MIPVWHFDPRDIVYSDVDEVQASTDEEVDQCHEGHHWDDVAVGKLQIVG